MVSAYNAADLVALLEAQVWTDIRSDFPGCRVGRTRSGGWYAVGGGKATGSNDAVVRLVQDPAISGLQALLRALAQRASGSGQTSLDGMPCP